MLRGVSSTSVGSLCLLPRLEFVSRLRIIAQLRLVVPLGLLASPHWVYLVSSLLPGRCGVRTGPSRDPLSLLLVKWVDEGLQSRLDWPRYLLSGPSSLSTDKLLQEHRRR
ncbi:hypothetical protein BV22DRAFT_264742 [Leucogyrophana mollusca]|uniref:Uncharacterized protein n=1 Tax=Leucogyrophana mollusca TaxID=85980 RepID=A0ACB8BNR5_9AGAM|nr:hypothetical protein BV22DRAFT_264742 [Leucogyrophana mollusca]